MATRVSSQARTLVLASLVGAIAGLAACSSTEVSDDREGYSKTTTKRTVDTPSETRTTTTTHEKKTEINP